MYIGRFAPSPTGHLHFGSLLAALASYLDAKSNQGLWRLRIDDLDPPRELPGAANSIIDILIAYGLEWDKEVVYQSHNHSDYHKALLQLQQIQLAYPCNCSRKQITLRTNNHLYDRHCLTNPTDIVLDNPAATVWRFNTQNNSVNWQDGIQGEQHINGEQLADFILQRKDQLWAYQLAVSVDDQQMGITHIIRGNDLLGETANQLLLISVLNYQSIEFSHIPILSNLKGQKLSKQNLASPLTAKTVSQDLFLALTFLGQNPNKQLINANKHDILHEAVLNWDRNTVPQIYSNHYLG